MILLEMELVPIEDDDRAHSVGSEEGRSREEPGTTIMLDVQMNSYRIFGYVLGVVTQSIIHGLLVKFIRRGVDNDGRIDEVVAPVRTAGRV